MKKLLFKLTATLIPIIILITLYVIFDPFKVIYKYLNYNKDAKISYNRDFTAIETLKNNSKTKKYESFVLGSSRSSAFTCADWDNYINNDGCFHLAASNESLYGIYKKMEWLEERKFNIKNVLIILDADLLAAVKNSEGHLYIKHPETSKESIYFFHSQFFKAFLEPGFLIAYIDYKIEGKERPVFSKYIHSTRALYFDSNNNDWHFILAEKQISAGAYYDIHKKLFYARDSKNKYSNPVILSTQKYMLKHIKLLFDRNNTQYKIVISPLYDQVHLSKLDASVLISIFGASNVYNYSGINRYTSDIHNYYETSHYRRLVGKRILDEIYGSDN